MMPDLIAPAIDALLPQTQCGKCGHAGCRPYADAIASGASDINRCAPGGDESIRDIASLLDVTPKPLDPHYGSIQAPAVAVIEEAWCIGCTLCIQACPVDAIVGAAKVMHTVIASECTGCELCIPRCPVDCMSMVQTGASVGTRRRRGQAALARERFTARQRRLQREREEKAGMHAQRASAAAEAHKRAIVERAMERARRRLAQRELVRR
jgi:electron transport complex protein RnfB